jgi:hypothetical protein
VSADLESARRDWEDGYRQLEAASADGAQADRLRDQLELVAAELRRRVGTTFTLSELLRVYSSSDRWASLVIEEGAPAPGWSRSVSMVTDAAFYAFARGAVDYVP